MQALLAYLEMEAERLVGRHTAITSAAAAAIAAATSSGPGSDGGSSDGDERPRQHRPGRGLFRAVRGLIGLGSSSKGQQQVLHGHAAQPGSASSGGSQQHVAAKQDATALWVELARTAWCPILSSPPEPALPWHSDGSGSSKQRLAAPCTARPRSDMWLVSAVMHVVDGDCR